MQYATLPLRLPRRLPNSRVGGSRRQDGKARYGGGEGGEEGAAGVHTFALGSDCAHGGLLKLSISDGVYLSVAVNLLVQSIGVVSVLVLLVMGDIHTKPLPEQC